MHVRSGYRSPEVNAFGNAHNLNCASNEQNCARHIRDHPDSKGHYGATACIVLPWLLDHVARGGSWTNLAWWIHGHLPYSSLHFFPNLLAFNISWHEAPVRRVDSCVAPRRWLIPSGKPGMHAQHYPGFSPLRGGNAANRAVATPAPAQAMARPVTMVQDKKDVKHTTKARNIRNASGSSARPPLPASTSGKIHYRAVHTKTKWRKAHGHKSLESAIRGPNGAAALFRGKARIDHATHGASLYALVWQQGASTGFVMRPDPNQLEGMRIVTVSADRLQAFDQLERAGERELASFFQAGP